MSPVGVRKLKVKLCEEVNGETSGSFPSCMHNLFCKALPTQMQTPFLMRLAASACFNLLPLGALSSWSELSVYANICEMDICGFQSFAQTLSESVFSYLWY